MNKQELIEKFKARRTIVGNFQGYGIYWEDIKEIFEQLDEPEKVKIPQMVADWIDACKENSAIGLYIAMNPDFLKQWNKSDELISWSRKTSNQELFARAWLDGYEVEKEKQYLVKIKGIDPDFDILKFNLGARNWFTGSRHEYSSFRLHHTRKELEQAGFGWVFSCEGVEVEEVEE
jgi:gp178